MILASYALQTELGDYDRNIHGLDYFVPQLYLPAKVKIVCFKMSDLMMLKTETESI